MIISNIKHAALLQQLWNIDDAKQHNTSDCDSQDRLSTEQQVIGGVHGNIVAARDITGTKTRASQHR